MGCTFSNFSSKLVALAENGLIFSAYSICGFATLRLGGSSKNRNTWWNGAWINPSPRTQKVSPSCLRCAATPSSVNQLSQLLSKSKRAKYLPTTASARAMYWAGRPLLASVVFISGTPSTLHRDKTEPAPEPDPRTPIFSNVWLVTDSRPFETKEIKQSAPVFTDTIRSQKIANLRGNSRSHS